MNKTIYICWGDDGGMIGVGVYGVFDKKEYAEECKDINKFANITIYERALNIGNCNGPMCKDYSE